MNNWLASMKLKPNKMQQTLGFRVREPVDWEKVKGLLDQLYAASGRLGALFPGRKFTLDGHLVAVLEKSSPPTCSTWTSHGRPVKGTTHSRPIGGRWRSSSRSRKVTLWLFATNPNTSLSCNAPRPARCLLGQLRPGSDAHSSFYAAHRRLCALLGRSIKQVALP